MGVFAPKIAVSSRKKILKIALGDESRIASFKVLDTDTYQGKIGVYCHFDKSGKALYVGCTANKDERMYQFRLFNRMSGGLIKYSYFIKYVKAYATMIERVFEDESKLIKSLQPIGNIEGR